MYVQDPYVLPRPHDPYPPLPGVVLRPRRPTDGACAHRLQVCAVTAPLKAVTVVAAPGMRECGVMGEGEDKQGHARG